MKINNIDFAIRFWVQDSNEKDIVEKVFSDLYEMNDYIKKTWKEDEFADAVQAQFSPVEIINGEPEEAIKYVFEICPYIELDEDEIEEYLTGINEAYEESEMVASCGEATRFIPLQEVENYEEKKSFLNEIVYVCPHCYRELEDCRCACYPYFLVQIDKLILPVIKTLNQKGYITTACCCGHINTSHSYSIYIAFEKENEFGNNIPKDSYYSKSGRTLNFKFDQTISENEFLLIQKKCIEQLIEWAESLPKL